MPDCDTSWGVEAALRERIKELTCLYGIARVEAQHGVALGQMLHEIAALIAPAWQYPEIASARIVLDGVALGACGFAGATQRLSAPLMVNEQERGFVEVVYEQEMPQRDEGPFLNEERSLIDTIAGQVALIVERKEAEETRERLENQLRHADRLATIGLLAAGVAHELNEPLSNVLGFAQLVKKTPDLPPVAKADVDKIESAALRAREAVRRLLTFARQITPQRTAVDLNCVVAEGLDFLEARFARNGIEVVRDFQEGLPGIRADAAQVNQVLINLVVNAMQAMPDGGTLTVRTGCFDGGVLFAVEDTGHGMSEQVAGQIFTPFFTTKGSGQGTGLGLPVAHGIVAAHGGSIHVDSRLGEGSRFEIRLPLNAAGDA